MELSEEVQSVLQKYKKPTQTPIVQSYCISNDDLINVNDIDNLSDDQTWLVESKPIGHDLDVWLHNNAANCHNSGSQFFDSRTFTRPKRNPSRPSIDKYNEEYFATESLPNEIDKYISKSTVSESVPVPVHFDLSQPVSSSVMFEKISSTGSDLDSFQNMSPPSLVNSMCSSTFTTLMESSIIRNDPVLREIRDADYSNLIFSQEPPLYQSFTESCSSITTEVAETFVRNTLTSINGGDISQLDESFQEFLTLGDKNAAGDSLNDSFHMENVDPNGYALNGTFCKDKSSKPFEMNIERTAASDISNDNGLRSSYEKVYEKERLQIENLEKEDSDDGNRTITKNSYRNRLNNTFQKKKASDPPLTKLNETFQPKINNYVMDANAETKFNNTRRLSDEIDEFLTQKLVASFDEKDKYSKRLSIGSTDSMDRLSSLSNSSRESKLMAEVDAIVEQQERSLNLHVMSTPVGAKSMSKLFDNVYLSPIPNLNAGKEHLSDSEVSSEEFYSMRSSAAQKTPHRTFKSLSNLKQHDANRKATALNTTIQKSSSASSNYKSSFENLKSSGSKFAGSASNLKTLGGNLKGSYTSLKPRNANLPHITNAPAAVGRKSAISSTSNSKHDETFKVPEAPANSTFLRPKVSNLPRPVSVTGIPRPSSKIPAPRSTTRLLGTKSTSRSNLNEGGYY